MTNEDTLDFERLVAELSLPFINLRDDEVDDAIRGALGRMCERFGLDRSTLYRINGDGVRPEPRAWTAPEAPSADAVIPQ